MSDRFVRICAHYGIADPTVLAAAVLHDTIEDTEVTFDELKTAFGEKIASIVLEVTDDKSLPKHERKMRQIEHAATISPEAKMVKLADLICNLRDLMPLKALVAVMPITLAQRQLARRA